MDENSLEVIEKVLAETNQKDVGLIPDGLTRQHFIELDLATSAKGKLYEAQIKGDKWVSEKRVSLETTDAKAETEETRDLFATEVNDRLISEARSRLASRLSGFNLTSMMSRQQFRASIVEAMTTMRSGSFEGPIDFRRIGSKEPTLPRWYLAETAQKIKEELSSRSEEHYEKSVAEFNSGEYMKALRQLNKAFLFNSLNVKFYLLRYECFANLNDFKNAILTINKLMAILAFYTDDYDTSIDELKQSLLERIVFCFKSMGEADFKAGNYLDAYEAYTKAGELKPDDFEFRIKR